MARLRTDFGIHRFHGQDEGLYPSLTDKTDPKTYNPYGKKQDGLKSVWSRFSGVTEVYIVQVENTIMKIVHHCPCSWDEVLYQINQEMKSDLAKL